MSTLVAPLAAGVNGADSGTAEFYRRGTTTPVMVYSDPDGVIPLGKTAPLDANGGAVAYANESVLVRVRSSLQLVVREFTLVADDIAQDVRSASFTGTLPSGSQGAGGKVDERTVLDRWLASGGALDWKIRRFGVSYDETLITAFNAVSATNAPLFNVRSYGAVGDGVTNDYNAFVATYAAAVAFGGGIIFVPAGNYLLGSAFSITSQRVSMMGVGAQASIITSGIAAGIAVTINASASSFSGLAVQDLQIVALSSGANVTPLQIVSTPGVLLRNVRVSGFALAVDIRSRVVLHNCDFTVPSSATVGDYVLAFTSNAADSTIQGGTFTQSRATNTGGVHVSVANVVIHGAKVDLSALTAAAYGIDIDTASGTKVIGCNLITGVAATYGIRVNANVSFYENHNVWSGSGKTIFLATALTQATHIFRGSRIGRTNAVTQAAGNFAVNPDYEINELTCNGGGNYNMTATGANKIHDGARLVLRIVAGTPAPTITMDTIAGAATGAYSLPAIGAFGGAFFIRQYEFVWAGTPGGATSGWRMVGATPTDYAQ